MKNEPWVSAILKAIDSSKKIQHFDLNNFAFEKLKQCKADNAGTIHFDTIYSKLCTQFSIKKGDCMKLLQYFKFLEKIEFVKYKGVRIK